MEHDNIIVRYNEIGLKGKNRSYFEKILVNNIDVFLRKNNHKEYSIERIRGRILIQSTEQPNLSKIFGISSFSFAFKLSASLEKLKEFVKTNLIEEIKNAQSFKVSTQRIDKSFPIKSPQINSELGSFIKDNYNTTVSLKDPDLTIYVEIFNNSFFVFTEKIKGFNGLPLSSEGTATILIDSLTETTLLRSVLSAWLFMKRGVTPLFHFEKPLKKEVKVFLENFLYSKKQAEITFNNITDVLVLPYSLNSISKIKKYESNSVIFLPLLAYDDNYVKKRLKEISKLAKITSFFDV